MVWATLPTNRNQLGRLGVGASALSFVYAAIICFFSGIIKLRAFPEPVYDLEYKECSDFNYSKFFQCTS